MKDGDFPFECVECGALFKCEPGCAGSHYCGMTFRKTNPPHRYQPCGKPMCWECLGKALKVQGEVQGCCTPCMARIQFQRAENEFTRLDETEKSKDAHR